MTSVRSAEPNVTPMIDVLLVLLIIFMVANVRVRHTMDTQLPERGCEGVCEAAQQIVPLSPDPIRAATRVPDIQGKSHVASPEERLIGGPKVA